MSQDFAAALTRLSRAGVHVVKVKIPEFLEFPHINRNGGFVGADAHALHRPWLETRREFYDPWVLARLELGGRQSADDYFDLLRARERMKAAVGERSKPFDALALPTVPLIPPAIDALGDLDSSMAINRRCLRNTAIANFLDRPAISIPCHAPGAAPVGFMLMGEAMGDRRLMSIARGVEGVVNGSLL